MVNDIIDGISVKLNEIFGSGYEIYSDIVKQDLKEPCFFIALLNQKPTPLLGSRSSRENSFDIHYFPKNEDPNTELCDVSEKLIQEMEFITLLNGDILRGTKISCETVDEVLHFFINYNMIVHKEKNTGDPMNEIKTEITSKG